MGTRPGHTGQPLHQNSWQPALLSATGQALVGLQWTAGPRQSLMIEARHDGSAPNDTRWAAWGQRNDALMASLAPAPARASNLAWQATPLAGATLRRNNVFVRLAWQPAHRQLALDALWQPADGGQTWTTSLRWQGDSLRLGVALRLPRPGRRAADATAAAPQLPACGHLGVLSTTVCSGSTGLLVQPSGCHVGPRKQTV